MINAPVKLKKVGARVIVLPGILIIGVLVLFFGSVAAAQDSQHYVMDHNYFSCDIPSGWQIDRDQDLDEEYRIFEISLLKSSGGLLSATINVTYYAGDNEDFSDYQNFLKRNSSNILGETKNAREYYSPIKELLVNGRKGFELERERLIYVSPESKSDASVAIKELLYVLPSGKKEFYVLHYCAPREIFADLLSDFKRVAASFAPQP